MHLSGNGSKSKLQLRYLTGALLVACYAVSISGCGPSPEGSVDDVGGNSADEVVKEEMSQAETKVPDLGPATTVDFATWEGKDANWEIVEGKAKDLYAEKDFTNQTAPNLIVETWISEPPTFAGDKFLLIDFWATWCGPCRATIPELNQISKEFANDLIVVGLSNESVADVNKMTEPTIEYYSGVDPEGRTDAAIGIQGIPHVMLIDPSGKVAWQGFPKGSADPLTAERIQEIIDQYRSL